MASKSRLMPLKSAKSMADGVWRSGVSPPLALCVPVTTYKIRVAQQIQKIAEVLRSPAYFSLHARESHTQLPCFFSPQALGCPAA
ncbi:uncharacterized protein Dmoj_GI26240, isoform D [Drosophila mojavensis]|uniref:Uncharacterized protein, isoform A n=1 Tax=Drosophila mojavensis TaxID=7230 RepID=A0A0Q9XS80_DROMO|nr:uncharacterized protein Dmoj_GI26240, isoform A [Drosophila mojavensis]KRG07807.1 uncharacterized protein Dmoj_GI26240, isoform D [Drosophila mojavensis]